MGPATVIGVLQVLPPLAETTWSTSNWQVEAV